MNNFGYTYFSFILLNDLQQRRTMFSRRKELKSEVENCQNYANQVEIKEVQHNCTDADEKSNIVSLHTCHMDEAKRR